MALEQLTKEQLDRGSDFIKLDKEKDTLTIKFQSGPIKENGVNGCQIDELVKITIDIVDSLNKKFPCRENALSITKLQEVLMLMEERTKDRTKRNVEGINKV